MQKEHLDEEIVTYFKLYILLYADDTVILAENPNDLQTLCLSESQTKTPIVNLHDTLIQCWFNVGPAS